MITQPAEPELFGLAQTAFHQLIRECATYGLELAPPLELQRAPGAFCYYDLHDSQIYLWLPSMHTPLEELKTRMLASLLDCPNLDEFFRFYSLLIPYLIGHELGHAFRHRNGMFGASLWHEEHIANQFATAVFKHRLAPADKDFVVGVLRRALHGLAGRVQSTNLPILSYHHVLDALSVLGQMDDANREILQILEKLLSLTPEQLLQGDHQRMAQLARQFEQREEAIAAVNAEYTANYIQYLYCQVGWLYFELTSHTTRYLDEFARTHLNRQVSLLPSIDQSRLSNPRQIEATFQAYLDVQTASPVAARYFYKRYRRQLLGLFESVALGDAGSQRSRHALTFLDNWSDYDADGLTYVVQLLPPALRSLGALHIRERLDAGLDVAAHLSCETDRRLWRYVVQHVADEAAANTLERLALLEQTDVFRAISAESLIDLARSLCYIRLSPGETRIWQGDQDHDVYIVIDGELEALRSEDGSTRLVGTIRPGETFGEMAFFSHEPRSATVRARGAAECLVIREADLQILSSNHTSILMHIAGALTRRLAKA
jgi:hypothetical protein